MRVIFASSEAVPFAKTGGLGDVVGSLPRALARDGVDVSIILPAYGFIDRGRYTVEATGWQLSVPVSDRLVSSGVLRADLGDGVNAFLIDAPQYFARPGLYGEGGSDYTDNAERFAFFSRAILETLRCLPAIDVLHCHDWQAAMAIAFLRADAARYSDLQHTRAVLTIHNLGYQGVFWKNDWHLLGLDWKLFHMEALEFYDQINFLKGGIEFADALTTVSPTYAREIQSPEFGWGLDGVLRRRAAVLRGILNGVDYAIWSPEHDATLPARYSAADRAGKAICKRLLQERSNLPQEGGLPVAGVVSRLALQKGFDLIGDPFAALPHLPFQLIVLGAGDAKIEAALGQLVERYPERMALHRGFSDDLAHLIEAGSDMFLMPSRYEPCGLNQMYSLRYGTIPIVRATGGLADSVIDADERPGFGNGFKFHAYTPEALYFALSRALYAYRDRPAWENLTGNAMAADFSWERSAREYLALYSSLSG